MSRRASLPGAEELFRSTSTGEAERTPRPSREQQEDKSTKLQVASPPPQQVQEAAKKGPKHDQKVTFYCTSEDVVGLDGARLKLRAEHSISADRGKIVRAALAYVLEDFAARGEDSVLVRRLSD